MRISVRSVTEGDAESVAGILNPIILAGTYTIIDEPISPDRQRDYILALPPDTTFNVAVFDNTQKIVGIQDIQPIYPRIKAFRHVCEIATFVSLEHRRLGIGAALCRVSFPAAGEAGFRKIIATIRADNPDALAFYERQGFEVVGTAKRHALVGGRFVDEVMAERFLP